MKPKVNPTLCQRKNPLEKPPEGVIVIDPAPSRALLFGFAISIVIAIITVPWCFGVMHIMQRLFE